MTWIFNDGGRSKYFKGRSGDCVVRALAIATGRDYKLIYDELYKLTRQSPRYGVDIRKARVQQYFDGLGLVWTPTMRIGQGCKVHLRSDELPAGRLVCRLSGHVVAVVDGVIHDTHDCSREGERCVYGYWKFCEGL